MPQADWFAQFAASAPPAGGGDWFEQFAERAPRQPEPQGPPATVGGQIADLAGEVGHAVNPLEWVKGLYGMASDLVGTAKNMGAQHEAIFRQAQAAYSRGDYLTASRKFIDYLVPVVGPIVDRSADYFAEGKWGKGTGVMLGAGLQAEIPGALARVRSVRIPLAPRNVNAAERAAVEFGQREGIPVDAATATGNSFVRGTQWAADRTAVGSVIGNRARQAQGDAFAATGERLASRAAPMPATAEQAGQGVRDAINARQTTLNAQANTSYGRLRALEQQQAQTIAQTDGVRSPQAGGRPFTNVPLAVDVSAAKTAFKGTYDELLRESQIAPLQGSRARALYALDRLMRAPDVEALSAVDGALGDLKALQRSIGNTPGAHQIGEAVGALDRAVVTAAKAGGPDAFRALMDGRAATVNKYKALDVLDRLPTEPVQVFNRLTANKDTTLNLLRQVQTHAPDQLPQLGRAYLEGLLQKATAEGGWGRADGVFRDWQNLGPATKQLLFRDADLVKDLDSFFLLAKRASTNPNPSGTAFQFGVGAQGGLLFYDPVTASAMQVTGAGLSALLHSPRAVRIMVQGLRVPLGQRAAASAATAELATIAREAGIPLVPVTADQDRPTARSQGTPRR